MELWPHRSLHKAESLQYGGWWAVTGWREHIARPRSTGHSGWLAANWLTHWQIAWYRADRLIAWFDYTRGAVWNLANNSIFALRAKKTTENAARIGWTQNLPHAYGLIARSQAFWNINIIQMIFTILCLLNNDNTASLLTSFGNFKPN